MWDFLQSSVLYNRYNRRFALVLRVLDAALRIRQGTGRSEVFVVLGFHLTPATILRSLPVKGTISKALDLLAKGLSPFVTERLRGALGEDWLRRGSVAHSVSSADPRKWDAQIVLLLMWDHWNQVFRHDLTFVERCLVSELREFRNRWAHQHNFSERDTYRCLDSVQRLLVAVESPIAPAVDELRRESLQRLHDSELVESSRSGRDWFTALVTGVCGVILSIAVLVFFPAGFSWALATLILLVFGRLVYRMMQPTIIITTGPRQCSECSRVFYGDGCPYCERVQQVAELAFTPPAEQPILESATGSL